MKKATESIKTTTISDDEKLYIDSLNEKEKKAYEIAKSHLGSTFHLKKSNGYIQNMQSKNY